MERHAWQKLQWHGQRCKRVCHSVGSWEPQSGTGEKTGTKNLFVETSLSHNPNNSNHLLIAYYVPGSC